MKANELRLGNWISKIKTPSSIFIVKGILNQSSFFGGQPDNDNDDFDPHYDDCCGIPIDEKWLLGFGFEIRDKGFQKNYEYVIFIGDECNYYLGNGNWVTIGCVHQLQNLYFALTDEELTLKK